VSLSDDAIRRALVDRAESIGSDVIDLARVAELIAARGRSRRAPWTAWLGLAAALVVVAIGGAGVLARLGSPGESASPSASAETSMANLGPSPSPLAAPSPSLMITGCDAMGFAPSRCDHIVAAARARAGDPVDVVLIVVRRATQPDGTTGPDVSLGSVSIATVDFTRSDGTSQSVDIRCGLLVGPSSSDRVCSADPQVRIAGGVSMDIPCGPTPGDESHPCGPLPPDPDPAIVAASRPMSVPSLAIPLDHLGHYEVLVGTATIPNGAISERTASLADPRPTDYWIEPYIEIEVRPDRGGYPLDSYYGRRVKGNEAVHVYLVFDVTELDAPTAVLQVRDLVVR